MELVISNARLQCLLVRILYDRQTPMDLDTFAQLPSLQNTYQQTLQAGIADNKFHSAFVKALTSLVPFPHEFIIDLRTP